jgi:hypothetical protein
MRRHLQNVRGCAFRRRFACGSKVYLLFVFARRAKNEQQKE